MSFNGDVKVHFLTIIKMSIAPGEAFSIFVESHIGIKVALSLLVTVLTGIFLYILAELYEMVPPIAKRAVLFMGVLTIVLSSQGLVRIWHHHIGTFVESVAEVGEYSHQAMTSKLDS